MTENWVVAGADPKHHFGGLEFFWNQWILFSWSTKKCYKLMTFSALLFKYSGENVIFQLKKFFLGRGNFPFLPSWIGHRLVKGNMPHLLKNRYIFILESCKKQFMGEFLYSYHDAQLYDIIRFHAHYETPWKIDSLVREVENDWSIVGLQGKPTNASLFFRVKGDIRHLTG